MISATKKARIPDSGRMRQWFNMKSLLPLFALVLLVIVFTAVAPTFFTGTNFINILRQFSVLMVAALGATFIIVMGSIDLSVGSVITMSGCVAALMVAGTPLGRWGCFLIPPLFGLAAGLLNGVLFAYGKLPSFLVTLGTLSVIRGAILLRIEGAPVPIYNDSFQSIVTGSVLGPIPNIALWAVGALIVCQIVAFRTRFGRYLFAIGGGERVAKLAGLPVNRYKVYGYMVAGLLAGLAGSMLAGRVGAGTGDMGEQYLLDAIAAVAIGGTAMSGGQGGPHRTLLGALVITVLSNGLNVAGVDFYWQIIVKGAVVIAAVALTIDRSRMEVVK
jgi:ribose transport system permease protein/putative xylitol transport system permease protein